jgi:hypothetical protein
MNDAPPLRTFKDQLIAFATGKKRGIRNPFVMVPVASALEHSVSENLATWAKDHSKTPCTVVYLDRVMPETAVFQTVLQLPDAFYSDGESAQRVNREVKTLQDNLAVEMVDRIIDAHTNACGTSEHILLLLHLGALYPFAHASELLDELDRRRVQATVGIPFPGEVIGGKLSFFGERAQHYYPAHRVDGQVKSAEVQV